MSEEKDLWNKGNNLLSLYYYKYKTEFLGVDESQLAEIVGVSVTIFKKHSSNFRRLQVVTEKQSEKAQAQASVYEKYGNLKRYELFKIIKEETLLDEMISKRLLELNYPHRNLRKL